MARRRNSPLAFPSAFALHAPVSTRIWLDLAAPTGAILSHRRCRREQHEVTKSVISCLTLALVVFAGASLDTAHANGKKSKKSKSHHRDDDRGRHDQNGIKNEVTYFDGDWVQLPIAAGASLSLSQAAGSKGGDDRVVRVSNGGSGAQLAGVLSAQGAKCGSCDADGGIGDAGCDAFVAN